MKLRKPTLAAAMAVALAAAPALARADDGPSAEARAYVDEISDRCLAAAAPNGWRAAFATPAGEDPHKAWVYDAARYGYTMKVWNLHAGNPTCEQVAALYNTELRNLAFVKSLPMAEPEAQAPKN